MSWRVAILLAWPRRSSARSVAFVEPVASSPQTSSGSTVTIAGGDALTHRDAHVRSELDEHVLDLVIYEVGNVLARALNWTARDVGDQLDDLLEIVGLPLNMSQAWLREAAVLAERHALSFYDASWAAVPSGV